MTKVLFSLPTGLVRGIGEYITENKTYQSRQSFYQMAVIRFAAEHGIEWHEEVNGDVE